MDEEDVYPELFRHIVSSVTAGTMDKQQAAVALREAGHYVTTADEAFRLADAWLGMLQDEDQFVANLKFATRLDKDAATWRRRADALADHLGMRAQVHLVSMLEDARDADDFESLHWAVEQASLLLDKEQSIVLDDTLAQFAALNHGRCRTFEEFNASALEWLLIGGHADQANECAEAMERLATGFWEWFCCAEMRYMIDKDSPEIRPCIEKAESLTDDWSGQRLLCSVILDSEVYSRNDKLAAIKKLESYAASPEDWEEFATLWLDRLKDKPNHMRCVGKASSLSAGTGDG